MTSTESPAIDNAVQQLTPPVPDSGSGSEKPDISKYEVHRNGVEALVMRGNAPKRAVISFSSMNPGKYERWSWFYERHAKGCDDLYIIFKDDSQRYYLGDNSTPMYLRHIKFINEQLELCGLSAKNCYVTGSSMGGYAAVYFGFSIGAAGIVSINPQVDYASTRRHSLQNWERKSRETQDSWVDLNDFVYRFTHKPKIHIEHGDYPADVSAAGRLITALTEMKISYSREFTGGDHSTTSITKERLFQIIDFWSC